MSSRDLYHIWKPHLILYSLYIGELTPLAKPEKREARDDMNS